MGLKRLQVGGSSTVARRGWSTREGRCHSFMTKRWVHAAPDQDGQALPMEAMAMLYIQVSGLDWPWKLSQRVITLAKVSCTASPASSGFFRMLMQRAYSTWA